MKALIYSIIALAMMALPCHVAASSTDDSDNQLTIELTDGSLILGTGSDDPLSFHSVAMGDFKMPWSDIKSLEYPLTSTGFAKLIAANGDVYEVQLGSPTVSVITKFGKKELPAKLIRSVKVLAAAKTGSVSKPGTFGAGKLQVTVALEDGSSVVGQPPAEAVGFHSSTLGDIKVPWSTIRAIKIDSEAVHLTANNGDEIVGQLSSDALHLNTSFGKVDLSIKTVRSIEVSTTGATMAHLLGWWKLDDGSGTVAKDSNPSTDVHDGTLVNGPQWMQAPGQNGMSLHFEGNQYVSLGNILQEGYAELSIACWEKSEGAGLLIIAERNSWDQSDGIGLAEEGDALFGHWLLPGGVTARSKVNVQDNQWHHLVGTFARDGSSYTYCVYVDGQLKGTSTTTEGLTPTTGGWVIAAQLGGSFPFRGFLKDLRIYDCALSATQVQTIYSEQPSLSASLTPSPYRPNVSE